MNPQLKTILAVNATGITNGATSTGVIDTLGFDWATIDVLMSASNAATNKPSTLKLTEFDTSVISSATAITAFTGDGVGGFTIPAGNTNAANVVKFNIDLRKRSRYLFVTITPLTTQDIVVLANLGRAEIAPTTATLAGADVLVEA